MRYHYSAAVRASGSNNASPFSTKFNRLHIPWITARPMDTVPKLVQYSRDHPGLRFVSDGDPSTISVPIRLPTKLGSLRGVESSTIVHY